MKVPRSIKKQIKGDVKARVSDLNYGSNPIQKVKNKLMGRQVVKQKMKNVRETGSYDRYEDTSSEPKYYAKMKTGGVVNPNKSVSVSKVSKGRPTKSAEPKSAVKKATGKVGGISKAPKAANPKSK